MSQDPNEPMKDDDDKDTSTDTSSQEGDDEGNLTEDELSDVSGGMRPSFIREASPVKVS